MEFINKELLKRERIKKLNGGFLDGEPYGNVLIENFLNRKDAREIFEALKKEKFDDKESDLFSLKQTNDFADIDGALKDFYNLIKSKEFIKWLEDISGIKLKMKIDMSGSLYESCDYLLCHDDRLAGRKIAFVYYLSNCRGGEFVMYNSYRGKVGEEARRILPKFNSILLFKVGNKSFHSVNEVISGKRYAIGGWFH